MKDSLFGNKIAAVILIVLLLFFGLPVITHTFGTLFGGHHGDHHFEEDNPFGLAYTPYEELAVAGAAPEEEGETVSIGCLLAEADAERGESAAAVCASCHSFAEGGPNGTGPNLWNIVGREIASVSGFSYSSALRDLEGEWTYEKLDPYLYNSGEYVPGTAMNQKIRKDNKRANILAYLGTLTNGEPAPFPECEAAAEEGAETAEGEGEEDLSPMNQAAEEAADDADFEAPGPGETELDDSTVNTIDDESFEPANEDDQR